VAHGVDSGEQVRDVILTHADLDGWVGAAELVEDVVGPGTMGDPPGPKVTGPTYAARLREEVVRPARTRRKRPIRKSSYALLATFII
jgi:glyoxylase-like metal-dependent hydrolase (beta-lactamase superfamily II)